MYSYKYSIVNIILYIGIMFIYAIEIIIYIFD